MTYTILVPGKPIAKKRPRFFRKGDHVGTYNPQETEEGRFLALARQFIPSVPLKGPLSIVAEFRFARPKAHYRTGKRAGELRPSAPFHHTGKPDIDNCLKFVLDALNGLAWTDDRQIVQVSGVKVWSRDAATVIRIEEVSR